ncbi:iron-containing alcohol dehydrogenase [Allofournierella sp. CML151]|uniref:iron-containing alcohol dehydrogenase n=1 Tax=Allofournierella sp. CML151 TaxID=2998082 RepID=UPI0022EACA35|nr:iron-containing alcohol dehydrogenase [Fournierella sp. CML151]
MTMTYYVPPINLLGKGCLQDAAAPIKAMGCKKALISTDKFLTGNGTVDKVAKMLESVGVEYVVYNEAKPNPTVKNVEDGLKVLQENGCDFVVSVGGGSPQDCGKAIAVLATNGGSIKDYEGVNKSSKKSLPIVAITTTAGTSAEVTINYVITDEERHVKMIMVDNNTLAAVTVNDPELMVSMPASLTAATGMDALTHAVEAVVAKGANDVTDATALYAIKQIFEFLPRAVKNGQDLEAREQMCYACYLNGIAFSNAGLGNVHAMAHQLGGLYDLPHGVCNAMLLPVVEEENAKHAPAKFRAIAATIGYDCEGKTDAECVDHVIGRIKALSEEVGIPKSLKDVGVNDPDYDTLAENAMKDACAGANPVFFDKEKLVELFKKIG